MWLLLGAAGIFFFVWRVKPSASAPPPATDADLRAVLNRVLTTETDPNIVLQFGAIFGRNMLTSTKPVSSGYSFDRRPVWFARSTDGPPITSIQNPETMILPKPQGNIFSVRAYQLMTKTKPAAAVDAMKTYLATHGFIPGNIKNLLGVSTEIVQYLVDHGSTYLAHNSIMDNGLSEPQRTILKSRGYLATGTTGGIHAPRSL